MIEEVQEAELVAFQLFQVGLRVRRVEEAISKEYENGKMRCPVHLSIGQEIPASLVGVLRKPEDTFVSSHRSHAHYLAAGGDLKAMIAEIYGKVTGCSKGNGGSMHLFDESAGFLGSSAIVANSIPVGVGIAFSNKLRSLPGITFVFFGDGATEEGVFYESMNFAALWSLPVVFFCENNLYSVYTALKMRQPVSRRLDRLAKSLGIDALKISDRDPIAALKKLMIGVMSARSSNSPLFVEIDTYRFLEHCGPNDDEHLGYRPSGELRDFQNTDPLLVLKKNLVNSGYLTEEKLAELEKAIQSEIADAFEFAEQSQFPSLDDVLESQ